MNHHHAFNEVETESFQKIIAYFNNTAISKLPKSEDIIREDILRYFKKVRFIIAEMLNTA